MKTAPLAILLAMAVVAVSCSKNKEKYQYNLSHNGCETGEKSFDSKDAYCAALKNDEANNYCAGALRQKQFESSGCPGSFFD